MRSGARTRAKPSEKRRARRLGAALHVRLGKVSGTTRDLSASGVFFETDAAYRQGSRIHFEINLDTPWGRAICDCDGRIVRVERHDGSVGIAVQFSNARPQPVKRQPKRRAGPAKARRRAR